MRPLLRRLDDYFAAQGPYVLFSFALVAVITHLTDYPYQWGYFEGAGPLLRLWGTGWFTVSESGSGVVPAPGVLGAFPQPLLTMRLLMAYLELVLFVVFLFASVHVMRRRKPTRTGQLAFSWLLPPIVLIALALATDDRGLVTELVLAGFAIVLFNMWQLLFGIGRQRSRWGVISSFAYVVSTVLAFAVIYRGGSVIGLLKFATTRATVPYENPALTPAEALYFALGGMTGGGAAGIAPINDGARLVASLQLVALLVVLIWILGLRLQLPREAVETSTGATRGMPPNP